MNEAEELIRIVESRGGRLTIEGSKLVIEPEEAALPLVEELRSHKGEILELLAERPEMPAGVCLIRWEPVEAPVRLSECSTVTDAERFIESSLQQLAAMLEGREWQAGNWGLYGLLERLAMCGCVLALDDPQRAAQ